MSILPRQPVTVRPFSIAASGTRSPRQTSDDYSGIVHNDTLNIIAIAIADGISTSPHAREAAQFVVQHALRQIQDAPYMPDLREVFISTQQALQGNRDTSTHENDYGTTLIVAIDTPTHVHVGYVGNGAVWHIRGNADRFTHHALPWTMANYLNPHAIPGPATGKAELYKSFALGAREDDVIPTVVQTSKDTRDGDIFVLCTDGIYSFDEMQQGEDPRDHATWISAEHCMPRLIKALHGFLQGSRTAERLQEMINTYLDQLLTERILDDDATVAILITNPVFSRHEDADITPHGTR